MLRPAATVLEHIGIGSKPGCHHVIAIHIDRATEAVGDHAGNQRVLVTPDRGKVEHFHHAGVRQRDRVNGGRAPRHTHRETVAIDRDRLAEGVIGRRRLAGQLLLRDPDSTVARERIGRATVGEDTVPVRRADHERSPLISTDQPK